VNGALAANAAKVDAFLKSNEGGAVIESFGRSVTGREGYRKTGVFKKKPPLNCRATYGVRIILIRDETRAEGFQIYTFYPLSTSEEVQ